MNRDDLRSLALAGSCAAFVIVPNAGALFGDGEKTDRYDTVITPPAYAFAVWAPIFAACAVDTVRQVTRGRQEPGSRTTGWPLSAAYLTNTAWSIAAQSDRFAATPFLLPLATGFAHRRLQHSGLSPDRSTSTATGLLLGWTALASTVNITAEAVRRGVSPRSPRTIQAAAAALAIASAGVTATAATSRRGDLAVAATAGWGLLTTALDSRRPPLIRATSAAGVLGVAAVTALTRARRSPGTDGSIGQRR